MEKIKITEICCGHLNIAPFMTDMTLPRTGRRIKVPVNVYLIEHPVHGRVLVDTGLSEDCRKAFPAHLRLLLEPEVTREETALSMLAGMGITPEDIDVVLITHNDADHVCALKDFVHKAKRIVMAEHEYFWSCRTAYKIRQVWDAYMPYIDSIERPYYYGCAQGPVGRGFDLFGDDSILCIACPGHTEGQMAVMINKSPSGRFVNAGDGTYGGAFAIIASDAAFSQRNIDNLLAPGFGFDRNRQRKSLKWLQDMKKDPECKAVFCSHETAGNTTVTF